MTEVEAVLNSQLLTTELLSDGKSLNPICPSYILTMRSKIVMPPPSEFGRADIYCRKQWRTVQHIIEELWNRWRKEFLAILWQCQNWSKNKRHFSMARIVEMLEMLN